MNLIKELFFHSLKKYITALIAGLFIILIYLALNGFSSYYNYCDAVGTAGGVVFFLGGLSLVSFLGAFDMFGYGFSVVFRHHEGYHDFIDYGEKKKAKRKKLNFPYIPYFVVGIFYLIIFIVMNSFL